MTAIRQIADWVEETPFVDTHEHLIEESFRIKGILSDRWFPCDDWSYLFEIYAADDIVVAGMPGSQLQRFFDPDISSDKKFSLIAPFWHRIRLTGYAQALRYTFSGLYGENDLTPESVPRIADKYRELVQPGFYKTVLKRANIEYCQVNSSQRIFMQTEQPDILAQDLNISDFCRCNDGDFERVKAETGKEPTTLEEWLGIIGDYFSTFGPRAVAVKCLIAYSRPLNFAPVERSYAERQFKRHCKEGLAPGSQELKAIQDFLFRYCVGLAGAYGLAVKLHTGYLAGYNVMQLAHVRDNAADLCRILQDFPDTRFILMHIGYPYEKEFIALAKHYPNVTIDMCWAWIVNPAASVRFLKEFLLAVPANKIFTFGGDYHAIEPVFGHAVLARRGIVHALSELVTEGWLSLEETRDLVELLMRGNAHRFFSDRLLNGLVAGQPPTHSAEYGSRGPLRGQASENRIAT
ncbi:hypothetical protein MesoLj131c_68900 (plasmid) [Mesorhizobium sp. 131-3-5]|nr:hypothetical protein MesoLj131c_68900 [Mesorhizobium sp. 131-3-5]